MNSAGLVTLLLHLVVGGNTTPDKLDLKSTTIICKEIMYTFEKDSYKYVGISVGKRNYLTNYVDSDILNKEIDRQCKR